MAEYLGLSSPPEWKEVDRLAALQRYDVLDSDPEVEFDNIAKVASYICNAPIALITFLDEHRQWFKSRIGVDIAETPRELSICAHAILQSELFVVPDISKDPLFSSNPLFKTEPPLSFYAGVPLTTKDALPLGTLCVLDHKARPEGLTAKQADALATLAQSIMSQLELKLAIKAAAEGEDFTRRLLASSDDCIAVFDRTGHLRFMSDGGMRTMEVENFTAVQGLHWTEIWNGISSRDIDDAASTAEAGKTGRIHGFHTTAKGRQKWWDIVVTCIIGRDGFPQGFLCVSRDITELRQTEQNLRKSEKRLRALVDVMPAAFTSPQVVWFSDLEGEFTYCNDVWHDYTGLRRDERDVSWISVVHPNHREHILGVWRSHLARSTSFEMEIPIRRASDNTYRWFIVRGQPLKSEQGKIEQWFGIAIDIDERKQSEQALSESEERLQLALQAAHMIA
ncbi:PAS domain S-box protein [Microvirga aerilata]|uniref:PAS domain S-box protein n=1 Tax=Microvirga aerilata TaxID=670292 RepID=A0A937D1G7_9HYPH|nr:PAS domain S-box protein [Microvirga aerilata]MBL0405947.1 PAS domain S-box protein [Microvirga aerilata]